VPMLQCGLLRSNFALAIVVFSVPVHEPGWGVKLLQLMAPKIGATLTSGSG